MGKNVRLKFDDGTVLEGSEAGFLGNELVLYLNGITDFSEAYAIASDTNKTQHVVFEYGGMYDEYFNFTTLKAIQLPDVDTYRTDTIVRLRRSEQAKAELGKTIQTT